MELTEVKTCLRALLSSTNKIYDIEELIRDFENITGFRLPSFGYKNATEFLHCIPDTLKLYGDPKNPFVCLVKSNKSAHIKSLVERQKRNNNLQLKKSYNSMHDEIQTDFHKINLKKTGKEIEFEINKHQLTTETTVNKTNKKQQNCEKIQKKSSETVIDTNNIDINHLTNYSEEINLKTIDELENHDAECVKSDECINEISNHIKDDLRKFIHQYPDGVWCCDLPYLFFEQFHYDLDYKKFGCVRPGRGDWLLFDASVPVTQKEKKLEDINAFQENTEGDISATDMIGPEDKFVDLDLNYYIKMGQLVEVCGAEVCSPSEFYIHFYKLKSHLNKFMDDLQNFYNSHQKKYKMPDSAIKPGQICVGYYSTDFEQPEEWHRAEILKVLSQKIVSVHLVDFGTTVVIKKNHLRFLHKFFQVFPKQSVLASLAGVTPLGNKTKWSTASNIRFLNLLRIPYLEARVIQIDQVMGRPCLSVVLYEPNNNKRSINKQLVDENLAE